MTDKLKQLLDDQHTFPGPFLFKFIVPGEKKDELLAVLPKGKQTEKPSRNGKYVSVTIEAVMQSSDEVLMVFAAAQKIPGIISL